MSQNPDGILDNPLFQILFDHVEDTADKARIGSTTKGSVSQDKEIPNGVGCPQFTVSVFKIISICKRRVDVTHV